MPSKLSASKVTLFLYTGLMLYGAWTPPLNFPLVISDKWIHAIEFFLLFWMVRKVFQTRMPLWGYGVAMALITEGLQFFTVQRSPELLDLAADAAGYASAGILSCLISRKRGAV